MSMNQGSASSSTFRVKDLAAFKATLAQFTDHPVEVRQVPDSDMIYLVSTTGFWPDQKFTDAEQSEVEDASLLDAIASHLVENDFVILRGVSMEGGDELWFTHWTINSKGEKVLLDTDLIDCIAIAKITQRQYSTKTIMQLLVRLKNAVDVPDVLDLEDLRQLRQDAAVMVRDYEAGPTGSFPE